MGRSVRLNPSTSPPLLDEARRRRSALEQGPHASIEFRRVHRKSLDVEDKLARAALRAKAPVLSLSDLASAAGQAAKSLQQRVNRARTAKLIQDLPTNSEIVSLSGEAQPQPVARQPQRLAICDKVGT